MKKLALAVLLVFSSIFGATLVGDHYRYDLYQLAVDFEAQRSGLEAKQLTLNNTTYSYLENDASDKIGTIIMLHGFSATKENWLRFAVPFAEQYHLIALDQKGHGESSGSLSDSYSIQDQVDYLHAFIQALKLEQVHLIGNSMGGAVASLYAANFPDQVTSLVLISPAGVHDIDSQMEKLLDQGSNPLIAQTAEDFDFVKHFVMEDIPFIPSPVAAVIAERSASRYELNQKIFSDLRNDLNKGLDARFKDINAPALLIWGEADRVIHVDNIDKYASLIKQSEKLRLPGIGHLAMLETADISSQAALGFIQKAP